MKRDRSVSSNEGQTANADRRGEELMFAVSDTTDDARTPGSRSRHWRGRSRRRAPDHLSDENRDLDSRLAEAFRALSEEEILSMLPDDLEAEATLNKKNAAPVAVRQKPEGVSWLFRFIDAIRSCRFLRSPGQ